MEMIKFYVVIITILSIGAPQTTPYHTQCPVNYETVIDTMDNLQQAKTCYQWHKANVGQVNWETSKVITAVRVDSLTVQQP